MLLLLSVALADPVFQTPSASVQLDPGGNWPRMFPIAGGDHFSLLTASGGNYNYQETDSTFKRVAGTDRAISAHGDELDHGITDCPDGTFIHAATSSQTLSDDSVYLQKLDADFNVIVETNAVESDPEVNFLDPAVVCTNWTWGFAGMVLGPPRSVMRYYPLGDDGEVKGAKSLDVGPDASGASFWGDDNGLTAVGTRYEEPDYMWLAHWSTRLVGDDPEKIDVAPDGYVAYWYQRLIKVNDVWVVAHMGHKDSEAFDTQTGNVWLTAFDPDWNVIDQVELTSIAPPLGAFHPWVVQADDKLVVNYTYQASNYAIYVPIDLDATDYTPDDTGDTGTVDTGDTGTVDTDTGTDTGGGTDTSGTDSGSGDSAADNDTGNGTGGGGCGCDSTGGAGMAIGIAALGLVARRRRG